MPSPPPQRLLDLARGPVGRRVAEARRNGTIRSIAAEVQREHGLSPRNWRTLQDYAEEAHPAGAQEAQPAVAVVAGFPESRNGAISETGAPAVQPESASSPAPRPRPVDSRRPRTHLIIGDAHARPNQDLSRFSLLGKLIAHLRPDVVVQIGDWHDMESLSSYDAGKRCYEGRRYAADIAAGHEAQRLLHREIDHLPGYRPALVSIGGNHDFERIDRATNDLPQLAGTISTADLGWAERGWLQVPFLHPFVVDGVTYSHYFTSGVMGRPVGGVNPGRAMLLSQMTTTVAGHSHLFAHASVVTADGRRIHGVQVGCFTDAEEGYAGPANKLWWRGIVVLRDVVDGDFDLETWSLERMRRTFALREAA
jgi:hypothetical protein